MSSRWRRAWRTFLSKVETLNLPPFTPTDSIALHTLRARSLVDALLRGGPLAAVRKLKVWSETASSSVPLNVNELLRGIVTSARVPRARELPPPALVVVSTS